MHWKNSPTYPRSQIKVKKKTLAGPTYKTRILTADFGQILIFKKEVPGQLET